MFTFAVSVAYIRETGSKFIVNGKVYNRGEFLEIVYKDYLGLSAEKDSNTSFDMGDDIPEFQESVKSRGFSLTCVELGKNKEEIINAFMARVHSTKFTYLMFNEAENAIVGYSMNQKQFEMFLKMFGVLDRDSKSKKLKVRIKHETKKMIEWLQAL